jgi:beta-phosphoglucomutase
MSLRALIFDMDGVICDSEPLHMKAFQHILKEDGIALTDNEYYAEYLAYDDRGCFKKIFAQHNRPMDDEKLKRLVQRKRQVFEGMMKEHLVIYPGIEPFVKKTSERYPIGLASGASRLEVEFVLKKAKIRGMFAAIVSADDVKTGKPDPESFITALKILNERRLHGSSEINAGECLVIEDSVHGVEAARAAGMKCAAITTSYPPDQLKNAHHIIDSLVGLELETLEKIFN